MSTIRTIGLTTAVAAVLLAPVVAAAPALASGGRPGVQASGACSGAGTWELKAKTDDGGIEVEFEVDTNVAGQTFAVTLKDGPAVVFKGPQTTAGRSGSFSLERLTANRAGKDVFTAVARRAGNVCSGTVTL